MTSKVNILDADISKNGKYIAAIGKNHKIQIWNLESGKRFRSFQIKGMKLQTVLFHPTKPFLFSSGLDKGIVIWDIKSGKQIQTLAGSQKIITSLAISNDGNFLLSGGNQDAITLWNLESFSLQKNITTSFQSVHYLSFHPTSSIFALAYSNEVQIWDYKEVKILASYSLHKNDVYALHFDPKGEKLGFSTLNKLLVWDWKNNKIVQSFLDDQKKMMDFGFYKDKNTLYSCSSDGNIFLWDLNTGKKVNHLTLVENNLLGCGTSENGKQIFSFYKKNKLHSWKIGKNEFLADLSGHKSSVQSIDFTSNGKYLISASLDQTVRIWDVDLKKTIRNFKIKNHPIQEIRFSTNDQEFATAGSDGDIHLWKTNTTSNEANKLYTLKKHEGKVNSIDFHPHQPWLISAGSAKSVILWNLENKTPIYEKQIHQDQIIAIRFSKDGKKYATGSRDKTIKVWNTANHQLIHQFEGHQNEISDIVFSPSENILASSSHDHTIKIWDMNTGKLKWNLIGHDFFVSSIQFSKNGKFLISASRDKTIRIWNISDGTFIQTLSGEDYQITNIAITPNGKLLASISFDKKINLLELPEEVFREETLQENISVFKNSEKEKKDVSTIPSITLNELLVKDIFEEEIKSIDTKTDFLDNTFEKKRQQQILSLQLILNKLLSQKKFCTNASKIHKVAQSILYHVPHDQIAYYALMRIYILKQDLQMIFFMAKMAEKTVFLNSIYNFEPRENITKFYYFWIDFIFNQSITGDHAEKIGLEFINCKGVSKFITIPKYLLFFDIPLEVVQHISDQKVKIDYEIFEQLNDQPEKFRDYLFSFIELLGSKSEHLKKNMRVTKEILQKYLNNETKMYSVYSFDLSNVKQWEKIPKRISFQLKRNNNRWLTYYSNTDKKKQLLLKDGNYYLKINQKVKKAFMIQQEEEK